MPPPAPQIEPRLLTVQQAAGYLNLPKAEIVRQGIGRVRFGIRTLYDRAAIDAHLDELTSLTPESSPLREDPEAAFERFAKTYANATRRS